MKGGAWWATVQGVTKSRTRLSNFTFTFILRYKHMCSLLKITWAFMYFCGKVVIVYYKFVYLRKFFFKLSDDTALFELIQLVPPGTVLYFDKVIDM